MSTPNIAPGPWQAGKPFEPGEYTPETVIAVSAHGGVIAHVNCGLGNGPEHARLIAALPQLVEALQAARTWIIGADDEGNYNGTVLRQIDAALAKAGVQS